MQQLQDENKFNKLKTLKSPFHCGGPHKKRKNSLNISQINFLMVKCTMQYATNMVVSRIITDGIFVMLCCRVCCKVYIVQGNKNLGLL